MGYSEPKTEVGRRFSAAWEVLLEVGFLQLGKDCSKWFFCSLGRVAWSGFSAAWEGLLGVGFCSLERVARSGVSAAWEVLLRVAF